MTLKNFIEFIIILIKKIKLFKYFLYFQNIDYCQENINKIKVD